MVRPWPLIAVLTILVVAPVLPVRSATDPKRPASAVTILYPKQNAVVGRRVNVVLDPATDWSAVPYVQVQAGKTVYPVVDTSTGRHAVQGVLLAQGLNTITVRILAPELPESAQDGKAKASEKSRTTRVTLAPGPGLAKQDFTVVQTQLLQVFNRDGGLAAAPARFSPRYFHTGEQETECSGCHRLAAGPGDFQAKKPDDVLCRACHRDIIKAKYVHGPAALWYCLACHDPEASPVRYQFTPVDLWNVTKTMQPVEPAVFTISTDALFRPQTAQLLSDEVPVITPGTGGAKGATQRVQGLAEAHQAEQARKKEKQRELFGDFLEYLRQNPTDRVRIEVHAAAAPLPGAAGKGTPAVRDLRQLTEARAKALLNVLKDYGVAERDRVTAVGMGSTLPKMSTASGDGRSLNDRIEIVVHPRDVKVENSMNLPVLADRERVIVTLRYTGVTAVRNVRLIERLPGGVQYVKGSSLVRGRTQEPQVRGNDLAWPLGDPGADVLESVSYIVKKGPGVNAPVSPVVRIALTAGKQEEIRDFDPARPEKRGKNVQETCTTCHPGMLKGAFKHGPAAAGTCTLCHDPHASNYFWWVRAPSWKLCTTCHDEKKTTGHLVASVRGKVSHPTRGRVDPLRPERMLACISCHEPHSSPVKELLAYEIRETYQICGFCHAGK
ncbi:MAG: cytochrome c3 family protein [Nitrospirota bacterium]